MLFGLDIKQLILFAILIGAIVLLFTEWICIDLVAILIILALSLSGVLTPEEALSGFSSEPAIMLAAIFVISGALNQTGLSEQLGNWIKRLAGTSFQRSIGVIMPSVASFLTPIGHHGNLLIYGPGRYQFSDFLRVGIPLTILIAIIVSMMAPILWP